MNVRQLLVAEERGRQTPLSCYSVDIILHQERQEGDTGHKALMPGINVLAGEVCE